MIDQRSDVAIGCCIGHASIAEEGFALSKSCRAAAVTTLFLLHQRNQKAFEQIADNERPRAENEDIEQRGRRSLAEAAIPLDERVRMACSIGRRIDGAHGRSCDVRRRVPGGGRRPCPEGGPRPLPRDDLGSACFHFTN